MAYDFDGTDDYIEADSSPVSTVPVTMACWFRPDTTTVSLALIALSDGIGDERLQLLAAGTVSGKPIRAQSVDGGTTVFASSNDGFSANRWHHAAAVFTSATSRRAFIDGVGGTTTASTSTVTGLDQVNLGCTIAASARAAHLNGRLAEVGIWDVALTATEIQALARGFRPSLVRPNNLVLYVPLVRGVTDYIANRSLTTSGAVVIEHPKRIA